MPGELTETLGDLIDNHHGVGAWCPGGHGARPAYFGFNDQGQICAAISALLQGIALTALTCATLLQLS